VLKCWIVKSYINQKVRHDPKIKSKSNVRIKKKRKWKLFNYMSRTKNSFWTLPNPKNSPLRPPTVKKSQNCVKAAIAFVCKTCKRQLLFALLQLIIFVCTIAIENILSTTIIVNFCMPYCNSQHFYGTTSFVWTNATITINITS